MVGTLHKFTYKHLNKGRKRRDARLPRRERVLVSEALRRFGFRYWENVEIINPSFTNRKGEVIGGQQWIDYIVRDRDGKLFAIEFFPHWGGNARPHKYQLRWLEEKKLFLSARGMDMLVLKRWGDTSQIYWMRIQTFLHLRKAGRRAGSGGSETFTAT